MSEQACGQRIERLTERLTGLDARRQELAIDRAGQFSSGASRIRTGDIRVAWAERRRTSVTSASCSVTP